MRTWELVVRTANSVYQLRSRPNGIRRLTADEHGLRGEPWQAFSRMGPVLRGQPLRLWWTTASRGRSFHGGVLVTGPVLDVAVRETEVPELAGDAAALRADGAAAAGAVTGAELGELPAAPADAVPVPALPAAPLPATPLPALQATDPVLSEVVTQLDEQDRRES